TAGRHRDEFTVAGPATDGVPPDTRAAGNRGGAPIGFPGEGPEPGRLAPVVGPGKGPFARGELFGVGPRPAFPAPCLPAAALYQLLRRRNPAPYEFFFNLGEGECLVGASPEMYVRVTGDRVETCPISGTIRRGTDPLGDAENIRTLLNSAKEESE